MAKMAGRDKYTRMIKQIGPGAAQEVGKVMFALGEAVQVDAQISITTGSVSGKGHVASRPGEAPNNDTGTLANNIETVSVGELRVEVSSNAPYSAALEYGTSRMEERPFMRPALAKNRKLIAATIDAAVARAVKKAKANG